MSYTLLKKIWKILECSKKENIPNTILVYFLPVLKNTFLNILILMVILSCILIFNFT